MSWYRDGSISLTNGSKTVTGSGTAWLDNVTPSSGLKTPAGIEEIESISANGTLQLAVPYTGPTASNIAYAAIPTQGLVPSLAKSAIGLLSSIGEMKDEYQAGFLARYSDLLSKVDISALQDADGSALSGYDGGTLQDIADYNKQMQSYVALRAYTGRAKGVRITTPGIAGVFLRDLGDTTTADNGGTVIVDASGRRWKRSFAGQLDVKWFGALGNGSADDAPPIQAAIDYASSIAPTSYPVGWTILLFPLGTYRCNTPLVHKSGVMLMSEGPGRAGGATIVGYGAQVITTPSSRQDALGLCGLKIAGGSPATRVAVLWQNVGNSTLAFVSTNNTQDQGIWVKAGVANHYHHILVVNALLDRTRTTDAGAFQIADSDPVIHACEITGSAGGISVASAGLNNIAIFVQSTSGFFSNVLGQYGDVAWKVTGATNRLSGCRADASLGHAAIFGGSNNTATAFGVLNCGTDTSVGADQWDAVQVASTSNRVIGLDVQKSGGLRGRYVVNMSAFAETRSRSAVSGISLNTAAPGYLAKQNVDIGADGVPSVALDPSGYITVRTGATLDLQHAANMRLLYNSAESITAVVNAVPGQIYTLILNQNATLVGGSSIVFKDATASVVGGPTLAAWKALQFIANSSTVIKELGR